MCGIVGAVAERDIVPILMDGLKRLEYRGYDSAGLALITPQGLERLRVVGKVDNLQEQLKQTPKRGPIGIAHTRWATHGTPNEDNAHPHIGGKRVVIVHNGIIENYRELKQTLIDLGHNFTSDTDSEVVAVYIEHMLTQNERNKAPLPPNTSALQLAVQMVVARLTGAYAICVMDTTDPGALVAARSSSPLVVGLGAGEHFLASDPLALQSFCNQFIYLEEGDIAEIRQKSLIILNAKGERVSRPVQHIAWHDDLNDKQHYQHFMQKEIYEQPIALQNTLKASLNENDLPFSAFGEKAAVLLPRAKKIHILACGTSYFAGLVGKYWLEAYTDIPCEVEIASEFRYREKVITEDTLFVAISQSGETADTLAAIKNAKKQPHCLGVLCIGNVPNSAMMRNADLRFLTLAGPEIGVCSTKAFTTQLLALLLLTVRLSSPNKLPAEKRKTVLTELCQLPQQVEEFLTLDPTVQSIATQLKERHSMLLLGRGPCLPIALEGALKLKELSYIYAEAYPGGELKHGPLALVEKDMPVLVLGANDALWEKLKSNMEEVRARGGKIFAFIDKGLAGLDDSIQTVRLPSISPILAPIAYIIPLQLLAYHLAVLKGTNVDQPRNLAKSVTVE
jgi:glucosamine--fructose-6-phosphate aminotransferase (isomerizing)